MLVLTLIFVALGILAFTLLEYRPLMERHAAAQNALARAREAQVDAQREAETAARDLGTLRERLAALTTERDTLVAERDRLSSTSEAALAEAASLRAAQEQLEERLRAEIDRGEVQLSGRGNRLGVALSSRILFATADATLNRRGQEVLRRVASSLERLENRVIQVGGHTDARRLIGDDTRRYATNWELSTARATNVVRFLQEECGIRGDRLVALGYAQYRPTASNRSRAGRRRNRRIELTLVPRRTEGRRTEGNRG